MLADMTQDSTPSLLAFDGRGIPQALRDADRWAPWIAKFNDKRQKFDKIPRRADNPNVGLSTTDPRKWFTYRAALDCYKRNADLLAGVGYCMTHPHGIVGIDLDGCRDAQTGAVAEWAQEIITEANSYAEVSPSGSGIRIFLLGDTTDWMNHEQGIEVYGGSSPRFLTLTGIRIEGAPPDVAPARDGLLKALRERYEAGVRATSAIEAPGMPEILPELLVPDLDELELPYYARDFLETGDTRGEDRSREVHASAVALHQAGLDSQQVFSMLVNNPHAMEVALDHREQKHDKAIAYLWKEHAFKAQAKAGSKVASPDEFEDLAPGAAAAPLAQGTEPAGQGGEPGSLGTAGGAPAVATKPQRFRVQAVDEFLARPPADWIIKGVLPKATLAVVFGESGSGKTFFVLDMVGAIARGEPWRERKTAKGRVVYICAEGESGFRNRLAAYCQHFGADVPDIGVVPDAPNFMEKLDVKDLVASIKTFGQVSIIVVDTFAQVMPGANENSGEDVGRALAHCKALSRATGAMVVLVHHSGKDASRGARGWSGLRAAADCEIEISRADDDRCATVSKLKDGEDGTEFGFRLTTVQIGTDEDGEPRTSCVVAPGEKARKVVGAKGDVQKIVLDTTKALLTLEDTITVNQLADNVLVQMPEPDTGKRDTRRQRVLQAIEGLVARGAISTEGGQVALR